MDVFALLAENKIRESIQNGELNNLPGSGKPLEMEDLSHIPDELRAGYRLLKNAGVLPEELEIKKEIISLHKLINYCYDEDEKRQLTKKLNEKILRFNILMEKRQVSSPALSCYKDKIYTKFGGY
ncbi:MAG: DnaJ family domain-containing protein [Elusimicrobiota bacterium]|uniref:Molecular chaperone DnaJ n=1 Tax=Desulforamulus profundi TaxID=1383067 RepID=A0A2C6MDX9_9FIRM|nr:DnaJ family domain-containing protein [Desulforamulus profundi]PHJ37805.1 molecular chaperone DnaJ [Desulforamulus profundi]